ncbi:hypothetical protein CRE_23515 [Caenorhabditis remanei]|uniref:Serpentine Receptor, class Z n=1 Tax=Caenorhabditis remanei TaxID=31234 RepID=E3MH49_CAERE|nr:hypothetical protein CRE_23515 [Caenorhabditis remanei]
MSSNSSNFEKLFETVYAISRINTGTFIFICIFLPVYVFLLILILPFFLHVYRTNFEREKATAVFPIIQYCKQIVTKFYIIFTLMLLSFVSAYLLSLGAIGLTLCVIFCFSLLIISEVNQIILSFLAIQRFSLYFFPRSERFLNFSENTLDYILWVLYGTSILTKVISFVFVIVDRELALVFFQIHFIFLNFFMFLSVLLYIPIVISIRKLDNLASAQHNKPHRFILWQLVVIVTEKSISIPAIYTTLTGEMDHFLGKFTSGLSVTPFSNPNHISRMQQTESGYFIEVIIV